MEKESVKVYGVIDKNPSEEVRLSIVTWHGKQYIDIRIWLKPDPQEGRGELPLKKGLRFSAELLSEFIKTLQKIDRDLGGGPEEPGEKEKSDDS